MTEPPTDGIEPLDGAVSTAGVEPQSAAEPPAAPPRPNRRPRVERVAALLIAAVFLLPTINGVLKIQAGPVPGCWEWCGLDESAARISLSLGIVGLLLAAAIWRRHLSAQAIALFICVTTVAVLSFVLAGALSTRDPVGALGPYAFMLVVGIGGAFAVAAVFLVAAVIQWTQDL
jgi:hypothetical protein